jgi:hypothetical protein
VAFHDPDWCRCGLADSELDSPKTIHFSENKFG